MKHYTTISKMYRQLVKMQKYKLLLGICCCTPIPWGSSWALGTLTELQLSWVLGFEHCLEPLSLLLAL
jgi:hypothetical protein